MPAWWPKRSSKSKELQKQEESLSKSFEKSSRIVKDTRPRSFDDVLNKGSPRISPRENKYNGTGSGSSGFSGFDSDHKALPLPRPMSSLGIVDQTPGFGSGSGSVSSVSSSGSSEDQTQFGIFRLPLVCLFYLGLILCFFNQFIYFLCIYVLGIWFSCFLVRVDS